MEAFKRGDTVRVMTLGKYVNKCTSENKGTIVFHDDKQNPVYFEPSMVKYCGREAKIMRIDPFYGGYYLDIDECHNKWVPGMFMGTPSVIKKGDTHSKLARQLNEEIYKMKNILASIASIKYELTYNTGFRASDADVERRIELERELETYRKMFNEKQLKMKELKKKIKIVNKIKTLYGSDY